MAPPRVAREMRIRHLWLLLLIGGLGVVPASAAPRVQGYDLGTKGGSLGQVARVVVDDLGYIPAERLATVLRGSWSARNARGVLTVGKRSAQFVKGEPRVVIQGQTVPLDGGAKV